MVVGLALGYVARQMGPDAAGNANWLTQTLQQIGSIFVSLLLSVLLTLLAIGVAGLRAALTAPDPEDRGLAGTLLAPFVGAVLVGNLDHYFMNPQFPHVVALFWLYAGLLAASARLAADPA